MYQLQELHLTPIWGWIKEKAREASEYCKSTTEQILQKAIQKTEPLIEKTKVFYNQHQKVIIIATTATIVYLLIGGKKKKQEDKIKKKKQTVNKIQVSSKTFVSDVSGQEYKQEPSTTVRVESSGKEMVSKKKVIQRVLQRIESSSEQEQTGDKIFFEMYKKYQIVE